MNEYKDARYFRLSSFYIACFLFVHGLELVNIETDPQNIKRCQFVFRDSPERELLTHNYNYAKEDALEVMVDPRKFVIAIKTLKDKIYQERF